MFRTKETWEKELEILSKHEEYKGLPAISTNDAYFFLESDNEVIIKDGFGHIAGTITDDRIDLYKSYSNLLIHSIIGPEPGFYPESVREQLKKIIYGYDGKFYINDDLKDKELTIWEVSNYLDDLVLKLENGDARYENEKDYIDMVKGYLRSGHFQAIFADEECLPPAGYSVYKDLHSQDYMAGFNANLLWEHTCLGYVRDFEMNISAKEFVPTVKIERCILYGGYYEFRGLRPIGDPRGELVDIVVRVRRRGRVINDGVTIPRNSIATSNNVEIYKNGEIMGYVQNIKIKWTADKVDPCNSPLRIDIARIKIDEDKKWYTYVESYMGREFVDKDAFVAMVANELRKEGKTQVEIDRILFESGLTGEDGEIIEEKDLRGKPAVKMSDEEFAVYIIDDMLTRNKNDEEILKTLDSIGLNMDNNKVVELIEKAKQDKPSKETVELVG